MTARVVEWSHEAAEDVLAVAATRSLDAVEYVFGGALAAVSGCLRGLFVAAEGHDLMCADYTAIEAVGLAELSGCEWRREVFRTHGRIYETSASRITGQPLQAYFDHKARTGEHHVDRKLGKVAELASGYGGWIGSWRAFGADEFMDDDEIKTAVLAWRAASPEVVELWGGQPDRRNDCYYGIEGAAVQAVMRPGETFYPHMRIGVRPAAAGMAHHYDRAQDLLYVQLPSGRWLRYHRPRLEPSTRPYREGTYALSYEGYNTNPKNGPMGWIRKDTYGPKLTENYDQAACRDILRHAIVNLEREGYPVVLHVYDEIASEVPRSASHTLAEFVRIMGTLPAWAASWPVKVAGEWSGLRYRK